MLLPTGSLNETTSDLNLFTCYHKTLSSNIFPINTEVSVEKQKTDESHIDTPLVWPTNCPIVFFADGYIKWNPAAKENADKAKGDKWS